MLYSTKRSGVPAKAAAPGDVFYCTDSREVFYACADGTLLCLSDLLHGSLQRVREPGPKGDRGDRGHQGDRGEPGKPGKDGQDSEVPGPQGAQGTSGHDGLPGHDGRDGKNGRDGVDGKNGVDGRDGKDGARGPAGDVLAVGPDELKVAVETARQQLLARRAATQAAIEQARIDAKRLTHGVRAVLFNALNDVERANNG